MLKGRDREIPNLVRPITKATLLTATLSEVFTVMFSIPETVEFDAGYVMLILGLVRSIMMLIYQYQIEIKNPQQHQA